MLALCICLSYTAGRVYLWIYLYIHYVMISTYIQWLLGLPTCWSFAIVNISLNDSNESLPRIGSRSMYPRWLSVAMEMKSEIKADKFVIIHKKYTYNKIVNNIQITVYIAISIHQRIVRIFWNSYLQVFSLHFLPPF